MIFSAPTFIFLFLPFVIIFYFLLYKHKKTANLILLISSLMFYSWGEPIYLLLLVFSIILNYVVGYLMHRFSKHQKVFLLIGVLINTGILLYFKYSNFFIESANNLLKNPIQPLNIGLPIGISFFTFRAISYLVDLYRKEATFQKNIIHLSLYLSFFPQLIAGPIVRYKDISQQINDRKHSLIKIESGTKRFVLGLAKKAIIADYLANIADITFNLDINQLTTPLAWIGILAFTFQIYYDFSGYSDMAIGLSKIFGFKIAENFNYPHISKSVTEFWRRWHISLSQWFKHYVYIPLGGSRCSFLRASFNVLVVFLITGFWHGASWNFIVWGVYFGVLIVIERIFRKVFLEDRFILLRHLYLILAVVIGWVFFRAPDLVYGLKYLGVMLGIQSSSQYIYHVLVSYATIKTVLIFILATLFSAPMINMISERISSKVSKLKGNELLNLCLNVNYLIIYLISVASIAINTYQPFIYFQF